MDFTAARHAMVDTQIRPNNVRDPRIVSAFSTVRRELFIGHAQRALAYSDDAVPVSLANTGEPPRKLLPPMVLAKLLQAALPAHNDRALDVGGATGYSAAILALLCGQVYALETSEVMAQTMRDTLQAAGVSAVEVSAGPLSGGLPDHAPYNLILINGAVAREPRTLFDQLASEGRLVCIAGSPRYGQAYVYQKAGGIVSGRAVFDVTADILPGFAADPVFVF